MLTDVQVDKFIREGYARIDDAFSRSTAAACRDILWRDIDGEPNDPSTWARPIVWLWAYQDRPFVEAANTPALHEAFDQLVGEKAWISPVGLGTFPIRFPTHQDTGDTGWHVDASYADESSDPNDFSTWKVNIESKGRALLMLFLLSDVGPDDAPTRIRDGSHLDVARKLAPYGERGTSTLMVSGTEGFRESIATGSAGTVYLCHPFLVHAAQTNRGARPRFLAQPPLYPRKPFVLEGKNTDQYVPVERAIRLALAR